MRIDALLHEPGLVHSLRLALRQDARIRRKSPLFLPASWEELHSRAIDRSIDIALVQPSFPVKEAVPPNGLRKLERLVDSLGPGSVIPFLSESDQTTSVLQALASPRFPFLLLQGIDDHPAAILRVLGRAETFRLVQCLWDDLPEPGKPADIESGLSVLTGWEFGPGLASLRSWDWGTHRPSPIWPKTSPGNRSTSSYGRRTRIPSRLASGRI